MKDLRRKNVFTNKQLSELKLEVIISIFSTMIETEAEKQHFSDNQPWELCAT